MLNEQMFECLKGMSEVLVAYEEPTQGRDEEDEEPPYANSAQDGHEFCDPFCGCDD